MPDSLSGWLAYIEGRHPHAIALGLDRVAQVSRVLQQSRCGVVITVGGTNGKGSVCAMLESILRCAGYRVGLYTSPHFLHYNERVRIDGVPASDAALCDAFSAVEAARGEVPLTYFEYGTLAAWELFARQSLDVIILEIGLGGRLDAVNIYEPDCAVVTSVDLDHMDFLGDDREKIGFEKAGIFRAGKPAICGDAVPPASLMRHAQDVGADIKLIGQDFGFVRQEQQWQFWDWLGKRSGLAHPALRGGVQLGNAATVLAALDSLRDAVPIAMQDIRRGLMEVELPGRFQIVPGKPTIVLDVAHNPQAAMVLAQNLGDMAFHPETLAVFGMMADKDIDGVIAAMRRRVTQWFVCNLASPRAASAAHLASRLRELGVVEPVREYASATQAYAAARDAAGPDDRIAAFGSFFTVADVMRALANTHGHV